MCSPFRVLVALVIVTSVLLAPGRPAWGVPETRIGVMEGEVTPFATSHIGAHWRGSDEAIVQLRWRSDGDWTSWRTIPVAHDLEDAAAGRVYGAVVRVGAASRVQTRALAGPAADLTVVAIDTVHGRRRLGAAATGAAAASAVDPDAKVAQPGVVRRSEWGADESMRKGTPSFAPLTKLVVHHTATDNNDPDPAATVRAMYAFHTQTRGWDDIGYNFLIDAQGRIYEGRYAREYQPGEIPTGEDDNGRGVIGAHSEGANTGSAGVALLGTFSASSPSSGALRSLAQWLAWKADRHDIDPLGSDPYTRVSDGTVMVFPNIAGHRDTKATSCPGDVLYERLAIVRREVSTIVAAAHGLTKGYWIAGRDGRVYPFGEAKLLGDARALALKATIVGMAATRAHGGYWLLGGDGGLFAFGDAGFFGSTGALKLNQPVVGMAATPSGQGYWLVALDGGIFAFGDAGFFGSTGAVRLNQPIVGMAATPSGQGYWLVARDGGIFAFGDARFLGSTGSIRLNSPVVGMASAADGAGYWLVARDGGIFAFGLPFHGSVPGLRLATYAGSVALEATATGAGYYVLGQDGGLFTFGDARFHGSQPGLSGASAAAALALVDQPPPSQASS